ncbi:BnaA05g11670D [Brassica napus]|uniref:BnaA05g11670D protein n=1 Tax=Brassica napus TaxID=3708 RepID=A0A078FCW9_BRANA|nr:BnaA05g11670D [Brassica napus]
MALIKNKSLLASFMIFVALFGVAVGGTVHNNFSSQRLFDLRKQQRLPRRQNYVWIGSYILISLFPFFILF